MTTNAQTFAHSCVLGSAALLVLAACHDEPSVTQSKQLPLTVQCADADAIPAGGWTCPDSITVECGQDEPDTLYVVDNDEDSCSDEGLTTAAVGPFAPGEHTVVVVNDDGAAVCSAELEVVDGDEPVLTSHVVKLWPPNHKFHSIAVGDCVSAVDACDGELEGEFIWASSDEPIDDIGDGHFGPDIGLGPDLQHACVRSERQGPKDGRVYTLGVRVVDRAGNETEGTCQVIVDHDQRGVTGNDSGDAYRIELDPATAGWNCDGTPADDDEGEAGTGGDEGGAGVGGTGDDTGQAGTGGDEGIGGTGGSGDDDMENDPF